MLAPRARVPLRRGLNWALTTPVVPFALKPRLRWRRDQLKWIALRPDGFTGKVCWKMLKDRRPLLTTFADKIAVRDYVTRHAGAELLTDCYVVARSPQEIERSLLPSEWVAKTNNSWGQVWIVIKDAEKAAWPEHDEPGVVIHPDELDWQQFMRTLESWLQPSPRNVEWAYRDIAPRVLIEQVLRPPGGGLPVDYKLFVFNGRVRLIQVDYGRFTEHRRRLYLPDWTPLDVAYGQPLAPVSEPPGSLQRMIEVAEALGNPTDFVRVDLYDIDGQVKFGELTNYPTGGTSVFDPPAFDLELGHWWELPPHYGEPYLPVHAP